MWWLWDIVSYKKDNPQKYFGFWQQFQNWLFPATSTNDFLKQLWRMDFSSNLLKQLTINGPLPLDKEISNLPQTIFPLVRK
jgi:hypothetical protein